MINKFLCKVGLHKFKNYIFVRYPHRVEGTCIRCGKKDVFL